MGREATVDVYDEMHKTGQAYNLPVEQSFYYPLFRRAAQEVQAAGIRSVLEVGCGSGGLAELLLKGGLENYKGFDFSPVAVENARKRVGRSDLFYVGDALSPTSYEHDYDGIVCTEVLEHVERDHVVVEQWRPGALCVCSVPNFNYPTHVRWFRHENEVLTRYGLLIDITSIVRVLKSPLKGKTTSQYVRQLRYARRNPKRLLGMMGINSFDWYAGWFVFVGKRRRDT